MEVQHDEKGELSKVKYLLHSQILAGETSHISLEHVSLIGGQDFSQGKI